MFDLQSLATLAAARALEMGSQEGGAAASGRCFPARRILNLRRKFNWTPRNEPVNTHLHPPGRLDLNVKVLIVKPCWCVSGVSSQRFHGNDGRARARDAREAS